MTNLKEQIANLQQEQRNSSLPTLFACYASVLLYWGLCHQYGFWALLGLPFLGVLQYYIVISGHEAVHKTLCYPLSLNEFLGVFGQALVGVNFNAYRLQHIDHHRCKSHETDPDAHIYHTVVLTKSGWPRFLRLTLGTLVEIFVKIRQKGSGGYGTERTIRKKILSRMKRDSRYVILAQLSLMGICSTVLFPHLSGLYRTFFPAMEPLYEWALLAPVAYGLLWIIPLFGVTVFLNRCRICIEHGLALSIAAKKESSGEVFGGLKIPTVDIKPGTLQRLLFSPFNFNYHCSHHLYMGVPHYNLPKLSKLLKDSQHAGHHQVEGTYVQALQKLMRTEFD